MIEWLSATLADVESLLQAGIAVAAAAYVASIWWRTKALVPTLAAMLVAGAVVWASNNVDWFSQRIADDTTGLGAVALVRGPRDRTRPYPRRPGESARASRRRRRPGTGQARRRPRR